MFVTSIYNNTQRIKKRWVVTCLILIKLTHKYNTPVTFSICLTVMHKFQSSHLKKNVYKTICPPLLKNRFFCLQEFVVSFFHFSNIIMMTKDRGKCVLTLFTETQSNLEDTAIQNRKYWIFFRVTSLFI